MNDILVYPAIFRFHDKGISITFPDLPGCLSCADNITDAVCMARDALSLRLWSDECDKIPFPVPSDPITLKSELEPSQTVQLIDVNMQAVRTKNSGRSANKMVTMPEWLLNQGKDAGINFSQLMQTALMQKLGIKREVKRKHYSSKH